MTRALLAQSIAQLGIVDASIMLDRYPITLDRWRDGQDEIPQGVVEWRGQWTGNAQS